MQQARVWVAVLGLAMAVVAVAACSRQAGGARAAGDDEAENQVRRARASLAEGDRAGAAGHLARAAALARMNAGQTSGRWRCGFLDAARDLDNDATLVGTGALTSTRQLDLALRRAQGVLARYRHVRAVEAWLRSFWIDCARELRAIIRLVQDAAAWTRHELGTAPRAR